MTEITIPVTVEETTIEIPVTTGSVILQYDHLVDFPTTGKTTVLYLDLETSLSYYWNGSEYIQAVGAGVDSTAIHKATAAEISALTDKATPVDADVFLGEDSASTTAFSKIKVTWANIKATLKAYFDTIYSTLALGETTTTAYRGDRGKTAYDHSQVAHAPAIIIFNDQADDYAILATDKDKHIRMQKATACNLTINNVLVSGESCTMEQNNDGQVTFVAGSGVTLVIAESLTKTRVKYSTALIFRTSTTGQYRITGDLE